MKVQIKKPGRQKTYADSEIHLNQTHIFVGDGLVNKHGREIIYGQENGSYFIAFASEMTNTPSYFLHRHRENAWRGTLPVEWSPPLGTYKLSKTPTFRENLDWYRLIPKKQNNGKQVF